MAQEGNKVAEADEDAGTARLVARAREEIAAGAPLVPKEIVDRIANGKNRSPRLG
jgi:hypothetical protein